MNVIVRTVIDRINKLYKTYEDYAFNSFDKKIAIIFDNNKINLKVYDKSELMDDFQLSFSDKEDDLYALLAINLFIEAFRDVEIHKYHGELYSNSIHEPYLSIRKPYLLVISKDESLNLILDKLVILSREEILQNNEKVKELNNKFKTKIYSKKILRSLNERIAISNVMFKRWYQ